MKKVILILCAFLGLAGCRSSQNANLDNSTVPTLDVERFMGRWYEIARYEHRFEKDMTHVTATYTLQDDGYIIRKRTGATLPNQLVIPSSFNGLPVVAIDSNAFVGAQNVVSVEIPDSVQWIDASAFSPSVKKVTCPADLDLPLDLKDQVTSLVLTSGVVSDCVAMFELEEVELLAGVTGIGVMAFFECDGLKTVTIHNGLREIGEKAFQNCSALTSIVLPDSVVEIGAWAFTGCWALSSIEIGRNVSYIGQCAFNDCPNLRGHITVDAENPYFYATNGTLYTAQGENLTAEMFG